MLDEPPALPEPPEPLSLDDEPELFSLVLLDEESDFFSEELLVLAAGMSLDEVVERLSLR